MLPHRFADASDAKSTQKVRQDASEVNAQLKPRGSRASKTSLLWLLAKRPLPPHSGFLEISSPLTLTSLWFIS